MRARGTDSAKVIKVIQTTALCGDGTKEDPVHIVTQYWDLEGKLLAKADIGIMEDCMEEGKKVIRRANSELEVVADQIINKLRENVVEEMEKGDLPESKGIDKAF